MGLTSNNKKKAVETGMVNNARVLAFQSKLKKQTDERLARNNRLICGIWGEPRPLKVV